MEKTALKTKQKILITDDSEINRSLLADMLGGEFEVLEAENGEEAVEILEKGKDEIDLVLLDIVMPKMDGFEVLTLMNKYQWIKKIPVVMISSETSPSCIERAYELGVTDFINRPFDSRIVRRRVINTLMLFEKQKKLIGLVTDQIYEREKTSGLMITILSHIVEFRNGESGLHVLHIGTMTELLLRNLILKTEKYRYLTENDISMISMASALHDIGKIGIPESILNKPGKLTEEEFEIMKTHSAIGASMLEDLNLTHEEKLVKYAYQICRWHHERYDGRGYPDGLKGEEIPIAAQIVALADVYDALTSERVYKKAYSHETAIRMIMNGECGAFSPLLLDCLRDVQDGIQTELKVNSLSRSSNNQIRRIADEMLQHEELSASVRTLRLLEHERIKNQFYAAMSQEIQFEYTAEPPMITISDFGAHKLGLKEMITDPLHDPQLRAMFGEEFFRDLASAISYTTPENPITSLEVKIPFGEELRWVRFLCRAMYSDETVNRTGVIGKVIDIDQEQTTLKTLREKAMRDPLTLLYNHETARLKIEEASKNSPQKEYLLIIFDLDCFKSINDNYGHQMGDRVLHHIGNKLRMCLRSFDIVARIGGDEFLLCLECAGTQEEQTETIRRIFDAVTEDYQGLSISVSMGVAETTICGREYDNLFNCADNALYEAKYYGRHCIRYYTNATKKNLSTISSIDESGAAYIGNLRLPSAISVQHLMKELGRVFEYVRLVDVSQCRVYIIDENGNFSGDAKKCFDFWEKERRCENCISAKSYATKQKVTKFEFINDTVYEVSAVALEMSGASFVLEMLSKVEDEVFFSVYGKPEFIRAIVERNGRLYLDDSTKAYNRRFYEEHLRELHDSYGVALVNIDRFNEMSEELKKTVGRDLVSNIYEILCANLEKTDAVIRYDETRFLIVLRNMSESRFYKILEKIRAEASEDKNKGLPNGSDVSIGGCSGLGKIGALTAVAEKELVEAVKCGNCVRVSGEK